MPNLPNSKKALRQSKRREEHNKTYKNRVKKLTRQFNDLVKAGNKKEAEQLLPTAYKAIDKAAKRNIFHKNRAARKKSNLARSLREEPKQKEKQKTAE